MLPGLQPAACGTAGRRTRACGGPGHRTVAAAAPGGSAPAGGCHRGSPAGARPAAGHSGAAGPAQQAARQARGGGGQQSALVGAGLGSGSPHQAAAYCSIPKHAAALPFRSGPKLALAVKLQAKLSQHMASLPAGQAENAHLHMLHLLQCLEAAARQDDGAALLQCLSKLQPQAAALAGPQRAAILGMVSPQHSRVVQEAAAALLVDSIAAEGSVEALALVPALLSQLVLSDEQQLRLLSCCYGLLGGVPAAQRSPGWAQCGQVRGRACWLFGMYRPAVMCWGCLSRSRLSLTRLSATHVQWLAAHAWNSGCRLAQSAVGGEQSTAFMAIAVQLLETCGPAGSDQLHRMQSALNAAAAMGQQSGRVATAHASLQVQQDRMNDARPAHSSAGPPAAPTATRPPGEEAMQAGAQQPASGDDESADSEAAAGPADQADEAAADARPSGIAIPSFRDVKQAEQRQAAAINPLSGGAAGAAAQQAAARPSGTVNPLAFLDDAPARHAAATRFKVPAAAAAPATLAAAATAVHVAHQPAPAGMAAPKPDAMPTAAVLKAGSSGLAAAAAAALASAAEDSMSEDEGYAGQGAGWLGAVMAAQQRAMGSTPAKQAAAGPAARAAPAVRQPAAASKAATVKRQPAADPAEGDGPEALSLGDSEQPARHGMLGFMGL